MPGVDIFYFLISGVAILMLNKGHELINALI